MFCKHQGCETEWKLIFKVKLFTLMFVSMVFSEL